ncbi:MAG: STAS domain-containing protein, partial [Clostridiales bacterium]|nr:STAS domain-containing protein [Clostridiales bacterium]
CMTENISYKDNIETKRWDVSLTGEIDIFNSEEVKTVLLQMISEKEQDVFIDCKNLSYIDSTGLSALVAILKKVKAFSGNVVLKNLLPNVFKVIKITNLDKLFIIEGDENE